MTEYGIRDLKQRVKENKVLTFEERKYINKALTEIQQYRAIGLTPELIEAMQGHNIAMINDLEEYQRIGTIEELQALKEKNEPKKAKGLRRYDEAYCPACNEVISDGEFWALDEYLHHCNYCGQAVKGIDWQ